MSSSSDVDCYVVFDHDLPLYDGCEHLQGLLFYVNHGFRCTLKDAVSPRIELLKLNIPGWNYADDYIIFAVMPKLPLTIRTSLVVCQSDRVVSDFSFAPHSKYYQSNQKHAFFLVKFGKSRYQFSNYNYEGYIHLSILQFDYETQKLSYINSYECLSLKGYSVTSIPTMSMVNMLWCDTSFHIMQPLKVWYETSVSFDILTNNRKTDFGRERTSLVSGDYIILESNKQRKTFEEKQIVHSNEVLPFLDFREYLESIGCIDSLFQKNFRDKVKTRKFINYIKTELRIYDTLFDWTFDFFHRRNPSFFEILLLNDLVYCRDITEPQPYSLLEWLPYDCIFRLTCQLSHFIFETK